MRQHGAEFTRSDFSSNGRARTDDTDLQHHMHQGLPYRHPLPRHGIFDRGHLGGLVAQKIPDNAGYGETDGHRNRTAYSGHTEWTGQFRTLDIAEHHVLDAVEQQRQQTCARADDHAKDDGCRCKPAKTFGGNYWLHVDLRTLCNEYALGNSPQSRYARQLTSRRGANGTILL